MPSGEAHHLHDLVVVERAGSVAGAYAAKLLADVGASVVLLEPPGGAPLRADPARWAAWCTSRRCLSADDPAAASWLRRADIVISSDHERAPAALADDAAPDAVDVRISPFGDHGPYAPWRGADIVDQAIAGHLYLSGSPDREPLVGPSDQAALAAGVYGAIGALAALHARRRGADDRIVDVSHHEVLASLHQFTELRFTYTGDVVKRMGNRYAGPGSPIGMYHAQDGSIAFTVATVPHGEVLLAVTGLDHLLDRPDVTSVADVLMRSTILDPALTGWLADKKVADVVELLQSAHLAVAPVLSMSQLLADPHLAERAYWCTGQAGERAVTLPGPPFRIDGLPWHSTPARPLGAEEPPPRGTPVPAPARGDGPLAGVRVLDLTRVWAGPLAARILADLGADVVMVEASFARGPLVVTQAYADATHFFPDDEPTARPWNRNGHINKYSLGKRSLCLDITTADGRAAFERLVPNVDVVVENYSPRVMPQLGLSEYRLRALNPALIYVTMPGYGRTGPAKDYVAYGPVLDSHAGLSSLMGYRDVDAWKCGVAWPDPVAGIHGALAILLALWRRDSSPERPGTTIEVAQFETAVGMVADRLVRAQLDGVDPRPNGNRHATYAPQGVYRCTGDDRWLALTVPDDATWRALCAVARLPAEWPAWSVDRRRAEHDAIDAALTSWLSTRDRIATARELQAADVPAAPVVDAADLVHDAHLAARDFWAVVEHPEAGAHAWPTFPARLSSPTRPRGPAPLLGQHNAEVLRDWAGMTTDEIEALTNAGIVATEPPAA